MRTTRLAAVVLVAVLLAGCGAAEGEPMPAQPPSSSPASPSPGMSDIPPPTVPLQNRTQPTPSDYIAGDLISGRVTKGGSGPCVEIVTDDEVVYSLHNAAGLTVTEGGRVTAKLAPMRARIYCGPGRQAVLVSFTDQSAAPS